MAKFLNKKEQVIDFQLTPLGRRKLSTGNLKPTYYSFYDDGVIYDSKYAGFDEEQNDIHPRIKNNTSFIEGILSFEEIESSTPPGNYLEVAIDDTTVASYDIEISPDKNILQTNKFLFDSAIGDSRFEGKNTQASPAWKVVTCQGEILSHSTRDTSKYDFTHVELDKEAREFNIPQLEVALYYTKLIDKPTTPMQYGDIPDTVSETPMFLGGHTVKLVRDDLVVYADEVNTEILTENFDIEVFEMIDQIGVRKLSTATITIVDDQIQQSTDLLGKTITINDGVNTVIFEFVQDQAVPVTSNAVGVVVSDEFEYEDDTSNGTQLMGTMYNLIAAIDNSFNNEYPTYWNYGSDAAGGVTPNGRCNFDSSGEQHKCVRNQHLNILNVTVGEHDGRPTTTVGSVPPPTPDGVLTFTITNLNEGKNGTITTNYSAGVTVTDFTGAEVYKVVDLERKFFEKHRVSF